MEYPVTTLLRESAISFGHIQLFRDDAGWRVSVCHYRSTPPKDADTLTLGIFDDPAEGLAKALMEDARRTEDIERKYASAPRAVGAGFIVEPAIAAINDPFAGMLG